METVEFRIPRYFSEKVYGKSIQIDFKGADAANVVKAFFYKCGGVADKGTGAAAQARRDGKSEKDAVAVGVKAAQGRADAIMGRNAETWNSHGTREPAIGADASQFFADLRATLRETSAKSAGRIVAFRKNADAAKVAAAADFLTFRGAKGATKADAKKVADRMWAAAVKVVAEREARMTRDDAEFLIDIDLG